MFWGFQKKHPEDFYWFIFQISNIAIGINWTIAELIRTLKKQIYEKTIYSFSFVLQYPNI
ncbi:hypothetical protein C4F50_21550 [Flavobacterium sp. KB82]|uniref:Uncharacterized protein n=1 Tax=Flavobacterium hungaricum TaxID=2082725 RepID=A0ABR9TRV8_9FLAO|nr:hypothetical protein [Flavobacterium hungaricum]